MTSATYRNYTETGAQLYQSFFVPAIATPVSGEPLAVANLQARERVVDVACGAGVLTRAAAERVGATGAVTGVDIAADMIEVARATPAGGAPIEWRQADASAPPPVRVVGVDQAWAQLAVARRRAGGPSSARAGAAALPFGDGAFDAVVACLVFEHIDEADAALAEVGRVLQPGGRFLLFLNHPLLEEPGSGWIDDTILEEQYWRIGPYLVEDKAMEEVEKDRFLPFVHRPLSRNINAMADAGLFVRRMEEPAPPPGFLARAQEYRDAATIPRLVFLFARRSR